MVIYGVGLLAGCMLAGIWAGRLLGHALGVEANVGGVGIAMLLLLFFTQLSPKSPVLGPISASGMSFWSAPYSDVVREGSLYVRSPPIRGIGSVESPDKTRS